jgi:hypothetical protein
MNKSLAMKKCKILYGIVNNRNETFISQYSTKLDETKKEKNRMLSSLSSRCISTTATKERKRLDNFLLREKKRFSKQEELYNSKIDMWKNKDSQFSITLESLT